MFTYNGIGTRIYGKKDVDTTDGSYVTTKFFTILFFPITPLGSFRVIKEKQDFLSIDSPKYHMTPVELDTKQVLNIYLIWWSLPSLLFFLALFG